MTNKKNYDTENLTQRNLFYKQFVRWNCNGSSVAPRADYMNNWIYQELISEGDYFDVLSDERIYLDLRISPAYIKEAKKNDETIRKFKGRGFSTGLLASAAAPFLDEVAKPVLKKVFSGKRRKR